MSKARPETKWGLIMWKRRFLRCRESNPGCLGENQKCYRLHHSGPSLTFTLYHQFFRFYSKTIFQSKRRKPWHNFAVWKGSILSSIWPYPTTAVLPYFYYSLKKLSHTHTAEYSSVVIFLQAACLIHEAKEEKRNWAPPGIEPGPPAPKAGILPLNYGANTLRYTILQITIWSCIYCTNIRRL